ncbi:DUF1549 domain-containing protein, partial [bacterium]|nr:DUF1549 domain-containing protein [bacterium]
MAADMLAKVKRYNDRRAARQRSDDEELRMPADGEPLSAAEQAAVKAWILAGAAWPDAVKTLPASLLPQAEAKPAKGADQAGEIDGPYRELVDRLLASPRYGERWARHWLDVIRFAESDGFEMNRARTNAWPYRDWVIKSLNDDLPYDQFLFDPIKQTDYYAMTAVFAGVRHGERAIRPDNEDELQREAAAVRQQLAGPQRRLAELQPLCRLTRTLVIDDQTADRVELLAEPSGVVNHAAGTEAGQLNAPGGPSALPNLGKQYQWWQAAARQPVIAYAPRAAGRFRIWISWGAGWTSHAADARYLLDADGNPATTDDQTEIAR